MNADLVSLLAWVTVELQASKPNLAEVRRALEVAIQMSANTTLTLAATQAAHRRLAMVTGCENPIGEMRAILGERP